MLKFTEDHEWLRLDGEVATVGITPYAQDKLGDLVFVELPAIGANLDKGAVAATVESVKAASDVYSPVTGTVIERNEALADRPGLVNSEPYGDGWMVVIRPSDASQLSDLLDAASYKAFTEDEAH